MQRTVRLAKPMKAKWTEWTEKLKSKDHWMMIKNSACWKSPTGVLCIELCILRLLLSLG